MPLWRQNPVPFRMLTLQKRQMPFVDAIDRLWSYGYVMKTYEDGMNGINYDDICAMTIHIQDYGVTHALCRKLQENNFKHGPRFPLRKSKFMVESFELPQQQNGYVSVGKNIVTEQIFNMAGGNTEEKIRFISWSRTFCSTSPCANCGRFGRRWYRSVADIDEWELASEAKSMMLYHVLGNARAMRIRVRFSFLLLMAVVFSVFITSFVTQQMRQTAAAELQVLQLSTGGESTGVLSLPDLPVDNLLTKINNILWPSLTEEQLVLPNSNPQAPGPLMALATKYDVLKWLPEDTIIGRFKKLVYGIGDFLFKSETYYDDYVSPGFDEDPDPLNDEL